MSKWGEKYPHICGPIHDVAGIVSVLRSNPEAELEARFGSITNNHFVAGIKREEIDRIIDMMQTSSFIDIVDDTWAEETDFFFDVNGIEHRTRVRYDDSQMIVVPETCTKLKMASVDIGTSDNDLKMDMRVSLKSETPVKDVPTCVKTKAVRIKQRKRFKTKCSIWAFDFGMSWTGETKTEAEEQQAKNDPVFEVECELINVEKYLKMHDNERVAASLLLKMFDLLPMPQQLSTVNVSYSNAEHHKERKARGKSKVATL